jgi:hypothetical protein
VAPRYPWGNFSAVLVGSASNTDVATAVLSLEPHPDFVAIVAENYSTYSSVPCTQLIEPSKVITEKQPELKIRNVSL